MIPVSPDLLTQITPHICTFRMMSYYHIDINTLREATSTLKSAPVNDLPWSLKELSIPGMLSFECADYEYIAPLYLSSVHINIIYPSPNHSLTHVAYWSLRVMCSLTDLLLLCTPAVQVYCDQFFSSGFCWRRSAVPPCSCQYIKALLRWEFHTHSWRCITQTFLCQHILLNTSEGLVQ